MHVQRPNINTIFVECVCACESLKAIRKRKKKRVPRATQVKDTSHVNQTAANWGKKLFELNSTGCYALVSLAENVYECQFEDFLSSGDGHMRMFWDISNKNFIEFNPKLCGKLILEKNKIVEMEWNGKQLLILSNETE